MAYEGLFRFACCSMKLGNAWPWLLPEAEYGKEAICNVPSDWTSTVASADLATAVNTTLPHISSQAWHMILPMC